MDDVLVIGAGPAGLMAALAACERGARVRLLAAGLGTTHLSPGWIGVLHESHGLQETGSLHLTLERWRAEHPRHPYALTGLDALQHGVALLRRVCAEAGLEYVGDGLTNFRLPTALGTVRQAALAPASFVAGDVRAPGAMVIAAPRGWRDFYPALCAGNLRHQGLEAHGVAFEMPELRLASSFDSTAVGLARLFDRAEVRREVAARLKPHLGYAARVGLPAILGLEHHAEAWHDLQDRLGLPVFEIPTLPPSVPGMRLFHALKQALTRAGVPLWLDMTVSRGVAENGRASGVVVSGVVREQVYRAGHIILATGGLYGGGLSTDRTGAMREVVFGLPLHTPGKMEDWFHDQFLSEHPHPVHDAGVRANTHLQPVDENGRVVIENVRIVGRLLAGYHPLMEGSTEGVWLATAVRAAWSVGRGAWGVERGAWSVGRGA